MTIADKIREALDDGKAYTSGQLWQRVNGAEVADKLMSISDQGARLRKIAGDNFIGRDQVERSAKGLARRCSIRKVNFHPKILAGETTYVLSTPVVMFQKIEE